MTDERGSPEKRTSRPPPYAGRWVAHLRGRIVGHGDTPELARQAAKAIRPKEKPEVNYVPTAYPLAFNELLAQVRPALPEGVPVYLVGGAVRDALLKTPTHDLDFAVQGNALRVARRVADQLGGAYYPLDQETETGRVVLTREDNTRDMLDFAALRGPDLESDLRDRDFTINAIAVDAREPQIVYDPLGGAADLYAKRLRACSAQSLESDPVRILRAIRQAAAFGLQIEPETRRQMREAVALLPNVSGERQRDELFRILGGPQPATALRALEIMGVLPHLLPELTALKGVTQSPPHVYEVWQHTLQTVQWLERLLGVLGTLDYNPTKADNFHTGLAVLRVGRYREQIHAHLNAELVPDRAMRPLLFFAALYHDVGKAATRTVTEDGRIRFLGHERVGAQMMDDRADALKLSNQERARVKLVVRHHMRPHHLASAPKPPTRRAVYRFFRDTKEAGADICLLNLADVLATAGPKLQQDTWSHHLDVIRTLLEAWWESPEERVRPPALLTGHDLMQHFELAPGPQIGKLLELIREAQATGEVQTRDEALTLAQAHLSP